MSRVPSILLVLLLVAAGKTGAQELVIRKAQPVGPIERRGDGFIFVLPNGTFAEAVNGTTISRSTTQNATVTYALAPDAGLLIRHTTEARVDDTFSNTGTFGEYFGLSQRSALVEQFSEKSSLEAAVENQARFSQATRNETVQRTELALQSGDAVPGLNLTSHAGLAEIRDMAGLVKDQTYVTLTTEQKLPLIPMRVNLSPSLAQEDVSDVEESSRLLTGWNSTLLFDAATDTTLSLGLAQFGNARPDGSVATSFRSYGTQLEQRLRPGATAHLKASYEEQWAEGALSTAGVFIGADATFSFTDVLNGGFQLRQRAFDVMSAADNVSETVFSFSINGKF